MDKWYIYILWSEYKKYTKLKLFYHYVFTSYNLINLGNLNIKISIIFYKIDLRIIICNLIYTHISQRSAKYEHLLRFSLVIPWIRIKMLGFRAFESF